MRRGLVLGLKVALQVPDDDAAVVVGADGDVALERQAEGPAVVVRDDDGQGVA